MHTMLHKHRLAPTCSYSILCLFVDKPWPQPVRDPLPWPEASEEDPEAERMLCVADKVHRAIFSLCSRWQPCSPCCAPICRLGKTARHRKGVSALQFSKFNPQAFLASSSLLFCRRINANETTSADCRPNFLERFLMTLITSVA